MAEITINHGRAEDFKVSCDLIFTDPPFQIDGSRLASVFDNIKCDHLVLISTMRQVVQLLHFDWELGFDFVLDAVVPKKSKSIRQPHYTHVNGFYLTRNKAKSIFNRKLRQRSDTFDGKGYWPSIVRAPRERLNTHGMAKNTQAVTDIIGSFEAEHIYDCFSGSGTTGLACIELGKQCTMTEINDQYIEHLHKQFRFFL